MNMHFHLLDVWKLFLDRRVGECYLEIESTAEASLTCKNSLFAKVTKATCCCSIGQGWGSLCDACPSIDSHEYRELCPSGKGFTPNLNTVSFL